MLTSREQFLSLTQENGATFSRVFRNTPFKHIRQFIIVYYGDLLAMMLYNDSERLSKMSYSGVSGDQFEQEILPLYSPAD